MPEAAAGLPSEGRGRVEPVPQAYGPSIERLVHDLAESPPDPDAEFALLRAAWRTGAWLRDVHDGADRPVPPDGLDSDEAAGAPGHAGVGDAHPPQSLPTLDRLPVPHQESLRRWEDQLRRGHSPAQGQLSLDRVHLAGDSVQVVVPAEPMTADPALDLGGVLGDCAVLVQEFTSRRAGALGERIGTAFRSGYQGMMLRSPIDDLMVRRAIAVRVAGRIEQTDSPLRTCALAARLVESCWRFA